MDESLVAFGALRLASVFQFRLRSALKTDAKVRFQIMLRKIAAISHNFDRSRHRLSPKRMMQIKCLNVK